MIAQRELKELLLYEPDTGRWTWRVFRGGKATAGSPAGTVNHHGYRVIWVNGTAHQAARLAVMYMTGRWPHHQVDHVNGVRTDDRWSNIREATLAENLRNRGTHKNNKCGLKGAFWCNQSQRWRASIAANGKQHHLGSFSSAEDAHEAYREAAAQLHGDFANAG